MTWKNQLMLSAHHIEINSVGMSTQMVGVLSH